MTSQPAYDFFTQQPITTAIPPGASLFGSLADSQQNPVRFAPSSILAYVLSQLPSQVNSQNLVGALPVALLPTRLQDIANIPPGNFTQGDLLYFGANAIVRLPAGLSGQVLQTQGPNQNPQWITPAVLTVGPSQNGQILYNNNGAIAGNAALTFNPATGALSASVISVGAGPAVLTSPVAATLQLGAPDAASPVAQTLGVQNVVAGTSNTAGVNWTFKASAGTGTGVGGDFIFQVAPAGGTGTTQNTFANAFRIASAASVTGILLSSINGTTAISDIVHAVDPGYIRFANSITIGRQTTDALKIDAFAGASGIAILVLNNNNFGFDPGTGGGDTFVGRAAAATLRFGAPDAAAPVAQTLGVQSVVAGTSNTAGVDWTFNASRGTGTGAGGRFIWQAALAGGSGTTQNALAQKMILDTTGSLTLSGSGGGTLLIDGVTVSFATLFTASGAASFMLGNAGLPILCNQAAGSGFPAIGWRAGIAGNGADTYLSRPAAANLQMGQADAAAPVAQTLGVQSVVAGTSNTAGVDWTFVASKGTGTGVGGRFLWQVAPIGGSGTSQNAALTFMSLDSTGTWTLGNGGSPPSLKDVGNGFFFSTGGLNTAFLLNPRFTLVNSGIYSWSAGSDPSAAADTIISRSAAASIQLGGADAAAPVAQTLGVQNVVAGTSNTAGVDWTLKGSASTGTGAGGRFIVQLTPAGSSGTAQNAFVNMLALDSTGTINLNNTSAQITGSTVNNLTFGAGGLYSAMIGENVSGQTGFRMTADRGIGWSSNTTSANSNIGVMDTIMTRAAAASLRFGAADAAAPVAQTLQVQSVVAGTSNTAGVDWTFVASKGTGTGAGGRFLWQLSSAGGSGTSQNTATTRMTLDSNNGLTITGGFIAGISNTISWQSRTALASNTDGLIAISNNAGTQAFTLSAPSGTATMQLGAFDAAAPIAQTLSVQSVVAGTSNTAGANWTFKASAGTGTGAGGSFIFQTAAAGSTGTTQNTFATSVTIASTNSAGAPILSIFGDTTAGWYRIASGQWGFAGGGGDVARLLAGNLNLATGTVFGWMSTTDYSGSLDTTLTRLSASCAKFNGAWASSAPNTQSGTTYTMVAGDSSLIFTSATAVTVTLLAASANTGRWLYIKETGAGAVSSASSNVVLLGGGAAQATITTAAGKFAVMQSDGTNWIIMVSN